MKLRRILRPLVVMPVFLSLVGTFASAAQLVQVQGIQQLFACGSAGCGGVFNGMIGGSDVGGNLVGGTAVDLMCIDYQNDTYIPSTVYSANLSSVTAGSDLSNTRHGGSPNPDPTLGAWTFTNNAFDYTSGTLNLADTEASAAARYAMVTYLASQYVLGPSISSGAQAQDDQIQSAIWQIMSTTPPATPASPVDIVSGSGDYLSAAAGWYVGSNDGTSAAAQQLLSRYTVVTNVNPLIAGPYPNQVQEFLVLGAAPEPRYILLLMPAMLGVWLLRRKLSGQA